MLKFLPAFPFFGEKFSFVKNSAASEQTQTHTYQCIDSGIVASVLGKKYFFVVRDKLALSNNLFPESKTSVLVLNEIPLLLHGDSGNPS